MKSKSQTRKHNQKYKKSFQTKKELNYTLIKDIRNLFRLVKETKAIKDKKLKDIKNFFEHEEENYYKPVRVTIILNMKVTVIEMKHCQLKNILIKLEHI